MDTAEYSYKRLLLFFKQFLMPYWLKFVIATFFAALGSAAWLYNAYAVAEILNYIISYTPGQSLHEIYFLLGSWLLVISIRSISVFISKYVGMTVAENAAKNAELFAIKHLSMLDISWHEKENTGNKLKKIDRGAQNIIDVSRLWFSSIVDIVVSVIGALIIISRFDPSLTGLLVVYLTIYFYIARATRLRAIRAMQAVNIKDEEITGLFYEIVANIRTIKILGMAHRIMEYVRSGIVEYGEKVKKRVFWFQFGGMLRALWGGIGRVSLFTFIIWNILDGRYEVGFLALFYGYFGALEGSVSSLSDVTQELAIYKTNVGRVAEILDEPINIDLEDKKVTFPKTWESIEIRNLSFSYGGNNILQNINLRIERGEKIGIIGLSGAGKSTLFKLLLKEYENYDGEILIGGVSLKEIRKSSYIEHMAAVLQETEVFNMSVRQNIALVQGREVDDVALLERALTVSHVNDFLQRLPSGIETMIGEKGVKLSGGERQRLGIARAVFKTPEILFLDEATSHLDIESEQKIQDSLEKFFKEVTAVVIAHRLSTIREMDRIIVIEGGKIIETGTFDELHTKDGRFREFWDKQKM